jgi:hypothetical protein
MDAVLEMAAQLRDRIGGAKKEEIIIPVQSVPEFLMQKI